MYKIIERRDLAPDVFLMKIESPEIANQRKAGQFVILRIDEEGERIPLTIADADSEKGTITLVIQAVGKTTRKLGRMKAGESIINLIGPLGKPTPLGKFGAVVCVGGGIGIAPIHPIAQAMKEAGNRVIGIIGARTKELVIMEDEMRAVCHELQVATDDGSYGFHGFVTQVLEAMINDGVHIDLVMTIGPVPMMRATCNLTRKYNLKTVVSLNPIMIDGTGMCGGCRVSVGGETKFACVDGPEFDGHEVDFDLLVQRQQIYLSHEEKATNRFGKECKLRDLA